MDSKERKIRKLLGNGYHLHISYENDLDNPEWILYREYADSKVYFSKDNEAIMSSKTNTIADLYEYAKKHHQMDEHSIMNKLNTIIAWIVMVISIVNFIALNNKILVGFILGIDTMLILYTILSHIIWSKNWNVRMLELKENLLKISKEK